MVSMGRVMIGPMIMMTKVAMAERVMQLPMATERPSRSLAPKRWDTTIPAPVATPTNSASSRFRIGMEEPTADSARSPTYLPTMTVSAVLYSCWAKLPRSMGMENSKIRFQGEPRVMSLAENNSFSFMQVLTSFFLIFS